MKKKIAVIILIAALSLGVATTGCLNGYDELEINENYFVGEDLEERADNQYEANEDVRVALYVEGFEADEDGVADWVIYATVTDPDGEPVEWDEGELVLDEYVMVDSDAVIDGDWGYIDYTELPLVFSPGLENAWDEGTHEIEFTILDEIGDKDKTITMEFEVVE
ncbi:hypothetical protein AMET1_1316 [Methanonatronarchaeum thermophilum]|uniref:Uncharacterized protein n=1 Tax=Methanonatronarchaeum thermophilum TaxID=1927129 RepID=A0A1Y3GAX6_9EURY|nr:hypothetical protein [Methanonatronarchaeum thermophilum]OUJ18400.1 hypothetical protein AMET1_1316 [Methanonatronarchaeum thermophilum]